MAKGLRSSVKKTHRSKLRTRVFAPVEDARTERLSAKLLELASQPRPEKTEMETEATGKGDSAGPSLAPTDFPADSKNDVQPEAQATEQAEGLSPCITCETPSSLSEDEEAASTEDDSLFYHMLGVCTDVVEFDVLGRLVLTFE